MNGVTVTFDDAAASQLPNSPPGASYGPANSSVTSRPVDYDVGLDSADTFPSPAPPTFSSPAPAGAATLANVFNGTNPNGTWSLYTVDDACAVGDVGTISGWSLNITSAVAASTTTTVASNLNPSPTGTNVTFTATVSSGGSPVTTGTVTFTEGATTLAANVAVNGSGQAAFSKSNFAEGNHIVTASYNGTPSFAFSSGTVNQRVNNPTTVSGTTYCNTGAITINSGTTATPYPSNISVTGAPTVVGKVTATLKNVTHEFPDDIDVLLVGPAGQNLKLVSDAGLPPSGGVVLGANNVTVNFDDAAAGQLAQAAVWGAPGSTVASKPVDYTPSGNVDTFPSPAPVPSVNTALSTFNGSNPNGTWSLYVVSDGGPETGTIMNGW